MIYNLKYLKLKDIPTIELNQYIDELNIDIKKIKNEKLRINRELKSRVKE